MSAVEAESSDEIRASIRAQVAAAGTSFYWAMRLLPEARREAMYAVYAFCREVDDIADGDDLPALRLAGLGEWRREVDEIFDGTPRRPLSRILAEVARAYRLRRDDFLAIVDGMEMDGREDIVAPPLAMLDLYCDRVASAVGRLSVRIFGCDLPAADRVAYAEGRALQLTNILRDLAEDADRGRFYLPRELLAKHGIPLGLPHELLRHPALPKVCDEIAEMAERYFRDVAVAMADCPRKPMRPAAVMSAVYHALLRRLRERGWTKLDTAVRVPTPAKLWLAVRHGLL
jgi:phytoene synthase